MNKSKIIQLIIFFILTLNTIKMNAQQNTSIGNTLTADSNSAAAQNGFCIKSSGY